MTTRRASGQKVSEAVSLADLPPGTRALVVGVDSEGPLGRRLLDLGFVPGTEVRVIRRAPLGDPLALELRGYQLCLRRRDARRIQVRPGEVVAPGTAPAPGLAGEAPAVGAALPGSPAR